MRRPGLLLLFLAACGGGGGSAELEAIEQVVGFGIVRGDQPTTLNVQVLNPLEDDAEAEEGDAAVGPFALSASAVPAAVAAGDFLTVRLVFTPPSGGTHVGQVHLLLRPAKGPVQEIVLKLSAVVETPTLTLLTSTLAFQPTLVGEERSLDLRIQNRNQVTPVALQSMGALPGEFRAAFAPRTLVPGETFQTVVTFEPQAPAVHDFQVEFAHGAGAPLRARITARCDTWIPEQVIDFGNVPLVNGETDWLEVDLPQDAISLSIEAIAPSSSHFPGLLGLEGPGGKVYENEQATGAYLWSTGFGGVFTATVPNTDKSDVQLVPGGGRYRFRLFMVQGTAASLAVRAIVENRQGAVAVDGVVDLNVFLAQGLGISDPAGDTRLGAILTRMDNIFAQVGLSLGDVDYYQLTDSRYDSVSGSEFESLLAESRVASERRVNLFFVLTAFGGGTIGVAGTIAGPARNGTGVSGVMSDYDFGTPEAAGAVAAHEIGHFLGLYHTTESNGAHDIIDDTLECPASGTNSLCTTVGNGNLMHWQYTGVSLPGISGGQAHVILAHPLVAPPPALPALAAYKLSWTPSSVHVELPPGFCGTCNNLHK